MTGTPSQRQSAVAIFAALAVAATSVRAAPQPNPLTVELKALGAHILAEDQATRYQLSCQASQQQVDGFDKVLGARLGHPVTVEQVCDGAGGTLVGFLFTNGERQTAQIARVVAPSTVVVIATWEDMKNCDSGMCDHFSSLDSLLIAYASDLDGDGILDPLIDFETTIGDQGRASHRFALWLSKTKHLQQLGSASDRIERVETFSDRSGIGLVVSTLTFQLEQEHVCFQRSGAMRACPKSVEVALLQHQRRLDIAREWSSYADYTAPPDAKTLAKLLAELGVTSEVKARLTSLAAPPKP